jgi:hypothetical protein
MNPCTPEHHVGPFVTRPDWCGWLGFDWVECRACRSTVTTLTAAGAQEIPFAEKAP